MSNFIKILLVGAEFFSADRLTDMTKLTAAFGTFFLPRLKTVMLIQFLLTLPLSFRLGYFQVLKFVVEQGVILRLSDSVSHHHRPQSLVLTSVSGVFSKYIILYYLLFSSSFRKLDRNWFLTQVWMTSR